jgi:Ca2+-binding EF-hand superfamily protein
MIRLIYCSLCVAIVLSVTFQVSPAQPPATEQDDAPLQVGETPVAEVLAQLGAKQEQGAEADELNAYTSHFDRTDPNKDGQHTREEYVENGGYMTPQARAGIFRASDGNGDDVVTRDEYILNRIITDEAKAIVQGMDDNKDGSIEQAEFIAHATELLSDADLAGQVYAAFDANSDGGITIPEYLRVWGQWARDCQPSAEERIAARRAEIEEAANQSEEERPSGPPASRPPAGGSRPGRPNAGEGPQSVDTVFERFDADNDGKLKEEEVPEFVRQFIIPADADGDGFVTKEELQASRERKTQSENF